MSRSQRSLKLVPVLVGAGLLALAVTLVTPIANACGAFFHVRALAPEQRPSLAREKVLIIHDAARGQQHFIREVAFRRADQTFGFVVPTPTRPTVAKVEKNPFTKLRERFPFKPAPPIMIGTFGKPYGDTSSGSWEGVEVLSVEKIGSFTAFVLAATDAKALAGWLQENQLTSTPESDQWLDHYVRMGFYYVAMRYEPPADRTSDADAAIAAETVRVSFATPIAYYPYFEPESGQGQSDPRLLELWYVGSDPVIPIARAEGNTWKRPLMPGKDYEQTRKRVEAALVDELEQFLPTGDLVVQTFQDQKRQRSGFHDILFAFAQPKQLTPEQLAALEPLLGVLDPGLIEERP
jgi:hypothetical protein